MENINDISKFLSQADDVLRRVINTVKINEIQSTNNVFNDLISCIIEQQIHYRSTKKIFDKMLQKTEIESLTIEKFEKFERVALKGVKLSMKKIQALNETLIFFNKNNDEWDTLSDEDVKSKLLSIKGVGDTTVAMILIYTLKRNDVFPYSDYHLKQIMAETYSIDSKRKSNMIKIARRWRPYSSYATRYLLEFKKQKKTLHNNGYE